MNGLVSQPRLLLDPYDLTATPCSDPSYIV
ncbi:hypothetical protein CPL00345_CDS0083 [Klebsiella phage GlastoCabaret]